MEVFENFFSEVSTANQFPKTLVKFKLFYYDLFSKTLVGFKLFYRYLLRTPYGFDRQEATSRVSCCLDRGLLYNRVEDRTRAGLER
jgi:hypothetical protein